MKLIKTHYSGSVTSVLATIVLFNKIITSTTAFPFFNDKDAKLKLKTIVSKKDDKVHVLISIFNTVVLKPDNKTFKDQLIQIYEYLRHIHRYIHNSIVKVTHHIATNPWIIILFLLACIIGLITYLLIKLSNEEDRSRMISTNKTAYQSSVDAVNVVTYIDNNRSQAGTSSSLTEGKSKIIEQQQESQLLLQVTQQHEQEQQHKELQDELQKQSLEQCRMIIEDLMSHAMRQKYIDQEYFSMQEHFATLSHSLAAMSMSPSLASPTATLSPMNSRRSSYHPVLPGSYLEKDEYDDGCMKYPPLSSPSASATTAEGLLRTPQVLFPPPHSSTRTRSCSNSVTINENNQNQYHHAATISATTHRHITSTYDHTSPSSVLSPMTTTESPTNLPTHLTTVHHQSQMAKTTTTAAAALMSTQSSHDDVYFNLPSNLKLRYLKGDGDIDDNDHGAWDTGSNNSSSTRYGGGGMSNKSVTSRTGVSDKSNYNNNLNKSANATTTTIPLCNTNISHYSPSVSSSQSLQLAAEAEAALQHQHELQQKLQAERDKLERETILLESSMNEYKREVDKYQIENVTLSTRCASLEQALQKATDRHTTAVKELQKKLIQAESMKNASEEDLLAMQHIIGIAQEEIVSANKTIDSLIEQLNTESQFAMESVAKSEERQLQLQHHYKSIIDDLQQQITHTSTNNTNGSILTNDDDNNNNNNNSSSIPLPQQQQRNDEFHIVKSQLDQQVNVNNEVNQELKKYMDKCQELHTKYSHVMSVHEAVREENHLTKKRLVMAEEEIEQLKTLSSPLSARNGNARRRSTRDSDSHKSSSTTLNSLSSTAESISMVEKLSSELKVLEAISAGSVSLSSSQHTRQLPPLPSSSSSSAAAAATSITSANQRTQSQQLPSPPDTSRRRSNNNNHHSHQPLTITTDTDTNSTIGSPSQQQQQKHQSPRNPNSHLISPRASQVGVINTSNVTSKTAYRTTTGSPRPTAATPKDATTIVTTSTSGKSNSGAKKILSSPPSQPLQPSSSSSSYSSPLSPPSSSAAVIPPINQKNSKSSVSSSNSNNSSNINIAKAFSNNSSNSNNSINNTNDNHKLPINTNNNHNNSNNSSNSVKPNTKQNLSSSSSSSQQSQQPPPLPPSRLSNMLRMAHSSDSDELWGKSAPRDMKPPGSKQNSSHHSLSSNVSVSSGMSGSGVGGGGSSIGSLSPTKSSSSMFNRLLQRP